MSRPRSRSSPVALLVLLLLVAGTAVYAITQLPLGALLDDNPRSKLGNVTVDGEVRPYLYHVPPGLDGSNEPAPLVLLLHGAGTGARAIRTATGFDAIANAEGAIAVYPNAAYPEGLTSHAWNAGFCCDAAQASNVDDLGYLVAIIDQFSAAFRVDADRIFVVGVSSGAMMAHSLAAHYPDRVAAIATMSGAVGAAPSPAHPMQFIPVPAGRVSVMMLHGDHDRIVPFGGGTTSHPSGEVFPSFVDGLELWAGYNGLDNFTEYEDPPGEVAWRRYSDSSGVEVLGGAITDAGHGLTTELPTGVWLWEFLKEHPRPGNSG